MTFLEITTLALVFATLAIIYSSVGHGGGSGYLAAMALAGFVAADVMKPTALCLNILVSGIALARFARVGGFRWRLIWPFIVTSIPCAFMGGMTDLDPTLYKRLLGVLLLLAAIRLAMPAPAARAQRGIPLGAALVAGAVIGFLSDLIGIGGGIFLSPIILLAGWGDAKQTAATSAAFILVNSVSGLLGHVTLVTNVPSAIGVWLVVVGAGGFIGAGFGCRRFDATLFRRALAVVLVVAGVKMLVVS